MKYIIKNSSKWGFFVIFILLLLSTPCWAGGNNEKNTKYWTGDGGKDISLAILAPKATGLGENQNYLPMLVQGEFVSNFSAYSAISVLNWEHLDEIYNNLFSGYYADDSQAGADLGHLTPTTYIMGGNITKTATGYVMQIQITKTADKMTSASYSATFSFADLDNLTGIRQASLNLLQKMGVTLTAKAQEELSGDAPANHVSAQTALARGVTAQRQGTEVAALSYYFQAAAYQPALVEAVNRSSVLAANISSGNIGEDARNDIQWRRDWVARLNETTKFFNSYFDEFFKNLPPMPCTLYYTSDIKQIGEIDYTNETLTLGSMQAVLLGSDDWAKSVETVLQSMQNSVQAVLDGLNATGRKNVWGLDNWTSQAFKLQAFRDYLQTFSITAELVNSRDQVIGRASFDTGGSYTLPVPVPGQRQLKVLFSQGLNEVNFYGVKADNITDSMTIRLASVNGIDAETTARNGVLQIQAVSSDKMPLPYGVYVFYVSRIGNSIYYIYDWVRKGDGQSLSIPGYINGHRITHIGYSGSFVGQGLTSVSIPSGIINISDTAFYRNNLTSIAIPDSVIIIGRSAFENNKDLTSITIGANVQFVYKSRNMDTSFPNDFGSFYEQNGKKAGTYTYDRNGWTYWGR